MPSEILYIIYFSFGGAILFFGCRWYVADRKLNDVPIFLARAILCGALLSITLLFVILAGPDMPSELPMSFLAGYGGALLFYGIVWFKKSGQLKGLPPFLVIIFLTGLMYSIVLLGLSIALKISFAVQFILSLLFNAGFKYSTTYKDQFSKKCDSIDGTKEPAIGDETQSPMVSRRDSTLFWDKSVVVISRGYFLLSMLLVLVGFLFIQSRC